MTRPDHNRYSIRFTSSDDSPLAFIDGRAVSLGQFRRDVQRQIVAMPHPGEVLISTSGRYAFSVALLASWLSGHSVVLPANHRPETLQQLRHDLLIACECDRNWETSLHAAGGVEAHGSWTVELAGDFEALRIFTSGSAGEPVRIDKSTASLCDEAQALCRQFAWPGGAVVATVPPQHLYGLTFSILLPWFLGAAWIDEVPLYPLDILHAVKRSGAGTLVSVPAQYQAMLQDRTDLRGVHCVSSAAPVPATLAREWQRQNGEDLFEIYGSTETGVVASRRQLTDPAWSSLPQVQLSVAQDVLQVSSPYSGASATRPVETGDRVELLDNGRFNLLGRTDAIVKVAGRRVSLTRVESSLLDCHGVLDAAVIAMPASGLVRDVEICAAVVAHDTVETTVRSLREHLRDQLEGVEVPRRIVFVEQLPRSSRGKLSLDAVRALFAVEERACVQA
jgi:4-coumarate--CoA ligase (photoactive yellow protein activation family)